MHYAHSDTIKNEMALKFINLCIQFQESDELYNFFQKKTANYDIDKVKDVLLESNLKSNKPILKFLDKHNFEDDLERFLKNDPSHKAQVVIEQSASDSDKPINDYMDESNSIEEQYAQRLQIVFDELDNRHKQEAYVHNFDSDESIEDINQLSPDNIKVEEKLDDQQQTNKYLDLQLQLLKTPRMKPTDEEIIRAQNKTQTIQHQR